MRRDQLAARSLKPTHHDHAHAFEEFVTERQILFVVLPQVLS
jgi:hypothetical protein